MKVFQIGFNRCGTTSIHSYFVANGIRRVHWDNGCLARRMFTNLANGDDIIAGYSEFDVFTDMEWLDGVHFFEGYKLFPYLAEQYPDAVFILNTRDREDWIKSRFRHFDGDYALRYKRYLSISSDSALAQAWRAEWVRHHMRVREFFSTRPHRFFICDIENDLPTILNSKLPEWHLDQTLFRLENRSPDPLMTFPLSRSDERV